MVTAEPRPRRTFWAGVACGGALVAYGLAGVYRDASRTHPGSFFRWFIGSALAHDLVVAPAVVAAGVAVARWTRPRWRPLVTAWLVVVGTLVVYSVPLLLGHGRRPTNPSALPNDYWWGLGVTVAAVTAVVGAVAAVRARLRR